MKTTWDAITTCLEDQLSGPGFQTFISSSKPLSFDQNIFTIEVPNEFSKQWFRSKCEPILQDKLPKSLENIAFQYTISSPSTSTDEDPDQQLNIFTPISKQEVENDTHLIDDYTFDSFIVGHNNRFAHAAAKAVCKAPAKAYNPLFIYGSVGLGKTHLLHAIAHRIKEKEPQSLTTLVSCEKFTNEMINAIKDKSVSQFRTKYRSCDVLIVDDVQFLSGKVQTQEEFFHTFNDLHQHQKQIILTSDRPPKEIPTLETRLRTRFEWGLLADIQAPELETRIAILRKKIEDNHMTISDDILQFIAAQIPTNVREMEGALTRISAYASLLDTEVTLSIAANVIRDMVGIKQEKPLTIATIQRETCNYFNLATSDLISKSRSKDISYARQIAIYISRELTKLSLPKIGSQFGNRDHTTVMYACDKIKELIKTDSETQQIVNLLITTIKSVE